MAAAVVHVSEHMTSGPFAVGPNEPMSSAERLMKKYDLHHLPVWTDGKLVGIVSEADVQLVRTISAGQLDAVTVGAAMTRNVYAPSLSTPLVEVVRTMAERRIGSAVVVDGGRIVGVFTATDAMRVLVDALEGRHSGPSIGAGAPRARPSRSSRWPRRAAAR